MQKRILLLLLLMLVVSTACAPIQLDVKQAKGLHSIVATEYAAYVELDGSLNAPQLKREHEVLAEWKEMLDRKNMDRERAIYSYVAPRYLKYVDLSTLHATKKDNRHLLVRAWDFRLRQKEAN